MGEEMELRHLKYLVALAEELHFGRAAIRLNISQPPLSQQIRQLEEELGTRLFDRTKREVRITEAGRRLVEEAHGILARVDHLSAVASLAGRGEIGHIAVGVPGGVNPILTKALGVFDKQYPGVRIELHYMNTGAQIEALREGRLDVGFVNLPIQAPFLVTETILREPFWLALPKGHRLAKQKTVSVTSLKDERMILFPRRVTPGIHDTITGTCRNAGFTLLVAHEVDSILGALTLVSAGLGMAFCTPDINRLWPSVAFRPIRPAIDFHQAAAYRLESMTPALETFLRVVRQFAPKVK
jgi:DNA-binding transcriptional LysR family regulator